MKNKTVLAFIMLSSVIFQSCKSGGPLAAAGTSNAFSPTVSITANTTHLIGPDTLILSIHASSTNLVSCRVDFKDGTVVSINNLHGSVDTVVSHVYLKAGLYLIAVSFSNGTQSFSSSLQITETYKTTLNCELFGMVQADTLLAGGATVVVDNANPVISEPDGILSIPFVNTGTHRLHVSHPWFQSFDTTISVYDSSIIPVRLTAIVDDYFPIHVGDHWTYDCIDSSTWGSPTVSGTETDKGTETWTVLDSYQLGSGIIYHTEMEYSGKRVTTGNQSYPTNSVDTSSVYFVGYVDFYEDIYHRISIVTIHYGTGTDYSILSSFEDIDFRRYLSRDSSDTATISCGNGSSFKFVRNEGIAGYEISFSSNPHIFRKIRLVAFAIRG